MHPCAKLFAGFALIASTVLSSCSGHPAIVPVGSNEKEDSDVEPCIIEVACNEPELDHLSKKTGKLMKFYNFCNNTVTIVSADDAPEILCIKRPITEVSGAEREEMEVAYKKFQKIRGNTPD